MKERVLMLVAAAGALALFLTALLGSERGFGLSREVPRPTTEEGGANGYRAVMQWLAAEGIRTISLQDRLDKGLEQPGLPPVGNVIIVTLPVTTGFRSEEFRVLDRWVRSGNTLIVLAALADQPDWAYGFGGLASNDINLLTGLQFQRSKQAPPAAAFIEPQRAYLLPNRPHAYFSGVREVVALSDFPRESWVATLPNDGFALSLAHDRNTGGAVLWTRSIGEGRVIVSGFASMLTNRALGLADNARFLANILGTNLRLGGAVLFDDVHQGLSAAYDPAKFYRDKRLYDTLGILAAVWLSWVLGSTSLSVRVARPSVPREAELVRATGGFFSRVLTPNAGARRMFDLFFRRLQARASHASAPDGLPWTYLERHPQITPGELQQLRQWYGEAGASRRVPLSSLHNLIVRIERLLAS